MSLFNQDVPQDPALTHYVDDHIFAGHADATFWVGRIQRDEHGGDQFGYYDSMARFRASVYIDQMGYLGPERRDDRGRELDGYDDRSVHFAVLEHRRAEPNASTRIVGSARLILKRHIGEPLPFELQVHPSGLDQALPCASGEVSRFIARHEDKSTQYAITLSLIRVMTFYAVTTDLQTVYFLLERPFFRLLKVLGLPLEQCAMPQEVVEPGGVRLLHPTRMRPRSVLSVVTNDIRPRGRLQSFLETGISNQGEGYYSTSLVGVVSV